MEMLTGSHSGHSLNFCFSQLYTLLSFQLLPCLFPLAYFLGKHNRRSLALYVNYSGKRNNLAQLDQAPSSKGEKVFVPWEWQSLDREGTLIGKGDTNRYRNPMCTHVLLICITHWALGYLTMLSAIANRVGTVKKGVQGSSEMTQQVNALVAKSRTWIWFSSTQMVGEKTDSRKLYYDFYVCIMCLQYTHTNFLKKKGIWVLFCGRWWHFLAEPQLRKCMGKA